MKKLLVWLVGALIIVALILFIQWAGWAGDPIGNHPASSTLTVTNNYFNEGRWIEKECSVCYKSIYEWQDAPYPWEGDVTWATGTWWRPGELAETIKTEHYVCPACRQKYQKAVENHVEAFFATLRALNVDLIEQNREERRQRELAEKKAEIERLKEQLKQLEKGD